MFESSFHEIVLSFRRFFVLLPCFVSLSLLQFRRVVAPFRRFLVSICHSSRHFVTSTFQARGLVSKETVVLCRWGRETQNFGFIN